METKNDALKAKQDQEIETKKSLSDSVQLSKKVFLSDYFKKRVKRMRGEMITELNDSANREPVFSDEYGDYKPGTFLHRSCVVGVKFNNGIWAVEILSENPITTLIIDEVRNKFVPDHCIMAHILPPRAEKRENIEMLYEIPNCQEETKE